MKFAVVGCQHVHIKMFIEEMLELGHQFCGIYDQSGYFLPEQFSGQYGVPLYRDMNELLDQGVELIGNAASNNEKINIIEWGESHGIHVMTDKPVASCLEHLERFKQVIERGKIQVGMMLTERFEPAYYTLKQLIDQGELGELVDFSFLKPHKANKSQRPGWFFNKAINGGLIVDIMIHDVDLLHWFTGKEITGHQGWLVKNGSPEHPNFYDNAQLHLLFDHITAVIKADWFMPQAFDLWGDGRIFATGTSGRAEIRSAGDILGKPGPFLTLTTNDKKTEKLEVIYPPNNLMGDFIGRIHNKPGILSANEIYLCNKAVLDIDATSIKVMKNNK